MSDVGRYRKLFARLWLHPGFLALTDGEKILVVYLLTGPQSNRLGLYVLSIATAAEALGTVPRTITKRLKTVCETFGWMFDDVARVLFIPSWFKWNPPENANVVKGNLKDLNEIPSCRLLDLFAANGGTIPETLRPTFLEGLPQRFRQPCPNQEQEQEQYQEQEQEPVHALTRGRDGFGAPSATAVSTTRRPHEGNGTGLRERFDAFWKIYPRKKAKDAAWRAWQKRKPSADLTQQICAALAWQVKQDDWQRENRRFVPYPATWINDGRWQDEPSTTQHLSTRTLALGRAAEEFLK